MILSLPADETFEFFVIGSTFPYFPTPTKTESIHSRPLDWRIHRLNASQELSINSKFLFMPQGRKYSYTSFICNKALRYYAIRIDSHHSWPETQITPIRDGHRIDWWYSTYLMNHTYKRNNLCSNFFSISTNLRRSSTRYNSSLDKSYKIQP